MQHVFTPIESGFQLFLGDGGAPFGAVRSLGPAMMDLTINVENAGDFVVPIFAVEKVVAKRVVVRWDALPSAVQVAVKHALDFEDYPPAEEDPEARAFDEQDDLDAQPSAFPPPVSPLDELPGRDAGSRYFAHAHPHPPPQQPPSTPTRRR